MSIKTSRPAPLVGIGEDHFQLNESVRQPYAGTLHPSWARCLIDRRLCCLTLSMAAWYLYGAVHDDLRRDFDPS